MSDVADRKIAVDSEALLQSRATGVAVGVAKIAVDRSVQTKSDRNLEMKAPNS